MNVTKLLISVVAICAMLTPVLAQSNSRGPDSPVVVGVLKSVDATGKRYEVLQEGKYVRKLFTDDKTKVYFVGLPKKADHQPSVGYGVKASSEKDGRIKSITFTPPLDKDQPLGEEKLAMSVSELFAKVDHNADGRVSYAEYSETIYYSPKHGPDAFRKADKDNSGEFDSQEFAEALKNVSWWKLSRKTPEQWIAQADQNQDGRINLQEFAKICTSKNHIDNIFKRSDRDQSGHLDVAETKAYIHGITHGKARRKSRPKKK
jgi:Ca2+-binding EF-hand superfamily protein